MIAGKQANRNVILIFMPVLLQTVAAPRLARSIPRCRSVVMPNRSSKQRSPRWPESPWRNDRRNDSLGAFDRNVPAAYGQVGVVLSKHATPIKQAKTPA